MQSPFTEFRKDGWPLCPQCGEDELASTLLLSYKDGPVPTLPECLADEFLCYACHWTSAQPVSETVRGRDVLMRPHVTPWRIAKETVDVWGWPAMPFRERYQSWIDAARQEVLLEVSRGVPLIEAMSLHTSTALCESPSVIARMLEWWDMATEA